MDVSLNKQIATKAGLGKKLQVPTFNKPTLSSTKGTQSSVFNDNTNSLKASVSRNISTTSLNRSYSSNIGANASVFGQRGSNWRPGTHFMGVSDFYHNRNDLRNGINTTGIGYDTQTKGYRSGQHDLELMTGGWTQRSERRAMQRMGMVDLSNIQDSGSSKGKGSWLKTLGIGLVGAGVGVGGFFAIKSLLGKNKAQNTETDMAQLNKIAKENQAKSIKAETSAQPLGDLSQMSETELTAKMGELDTQIKNSSSDFNSVSNQYSAIDQKISEQQATLDSKTAEYNQTYSQISNSKANESSAKIALDSANKYVDTIKEQLNNPELSDTQRSMLQDSLANAQDTVTLKQKQYDNACKQTAALQEQLQGMQTELTSLQSTIEELNKEKSNLETKQDELADSMEKTFEQHQTVETALNEKKGLPKEQQA